MQSTELKAKIKLPAKLLKLL